MSRQCTHVVGLEYDSFFGGQDLRVEGGFLVGDTVDGLDIVRQPPQNFGEVSGDDSWKAVQYT